MAALARFVEREPQEKEFAGSFAREIAPHLKRLEGDRLARRKDTLVRSVLCAAILLALVPVLYVADLGLPVGLFFWGICAALGFAFARRPARAFKDDLREVLIGPICKFVGDIDYVREPGGRFDHRRVRDVGAVGSYTSARIEDLFHGRYRDTAFQMAEARFVRTGSKSSTTVFKGLLFIIEPPKRFDGKVLIARDYGKVLNKIVGFFTSDMQRVALSHAEFERAFEVYSDDPVRARLLLTPAFLENLLALSEFDGSKGLTAAFDRGDFLLALSMNRNLFEHGSIWRSAYEVETDVRELLKDVGIVHRVIDYLHGDRPAQAG
jgi:hypothetical protein